MPSTVVVKRELTASDQNGPITNLDEAMKAAQAAQASAEAENDSTERLDTTARTLVGATALVFTLITAFGITSDRLPALLNISESKSLLIGAVVAALAAVALGYAALAQRKAEPEKLTVAASAAALVIGMTLVTAAAGTAFTEDGRPAITELSITGADKGIATIVVGVEAKGVGRDTLLRASGSIVEISASAEPTTDAKLNRLAYFSTLRPNDLGAVSQKWTVAVPLREVEQLFLVQVFPDRNPKGDQVVVPGASCRDQGDQKSAPACAQLLIPAVAGS